MGIDINAKLIYGCKYSELPGEILEEVDEMLDSGELDYASPWYDAPRDAWIVGLMIPAYGESSWNITDYMESVYIDLPECIQHIARVYVSPDVT